MKKVTITVLVLGTLLNAMGAWGAEKWKILSNDEEKMVKYYYDVNSVKKGKGSKVTAVTKTEDRKGAQKWQMEVDCENHRYRFINPSHEWQPVVHATPTAVLEKRLCQ
ncbi:MAG TPA: hypothetical protein VI389_02180 [Geobacteraceae bacterium]